MQDVVDAFKCDFNYIEKKLSDIHMIKARIRLVIDIAPKIFSFTKNFSISRQ